MAGSARLAEGAPPEAGGAAAHHGSVTLLALGALGVVFGDIGTSPLYAMHAIFRADHGAVHPVRPEIYGVVSLVFWSITIVVSVKYVALILRADNDGEGGIMALIALVRRTTGGLSGRAKALLVALGIFGASLFYGDGVITPAISVLSAVEGLEVVSPSLKDVIVPIAVAVLTGLFAVQRFGTGAVGRLFGPVMLVWFSVLALSGLGHLLEQPGVIAALLPSYGVEFIVEHPGTAFIALGAVVLVITGAEALYADIGHFGAGPIRRAWFAVAFPALTLNYLGQAALILDDRQAVGNPFFLLFPHWARIPVVVLATLATVIASQAVISGAFSVTRQAIRLGFLPRLTIRHTSHHEAGQIYVPAVNWGLYVAVVALVIGFGSSQALSAAYGIAVTGTLAIDTILFFVVVRTRWRKPLKLAVLGTVAFLSVDLAFLAANLTKVLHGGWFPLLLALTVFTLLMTWHRGRELVTTRRREAEGDLRAYVTELFEADPPIIRVPGCAVFLHASDETAPLAMRAEVEHGHALHECVVILEIAVEPIPRVTDERRWKVHDLGYADDGIVFARARYGFEEQADVPAVLSEIEAAGGLERPFDVDSVSYVLSRMTLVATNAPTMPLWRKRLFTAMARNAASPADYFRLPIDRTVTMGTSIEV